MAGGDKKYDCVCFTGRLRLHSLPKIKVTITNKISVERKNKMKIEKALRKLKDGKEDYSGIMMNEDGVIYVEEKNATEIKSLSYRLESKEAKFRGDWESGKETYTGPFFIKKKDKEIAVNLPENGGKDYIFDFEERESYGLLLSYNKDGIAELIYAKQGKGMYVMSDIMSQNRDSDLREEFLQMLFKSMILVEDDNGEKQ